MHAWLIISVWHLISLYLFAEDSRIKFRWLIEAAVRGAAPMLTALRKLQTSSEQLTTLHPDCLLLCLLAKGCKIGLSVLEDYIYEFSTSFPKYTSSVVQRNLKNLSQPYLDLANCYIAGKISELESCVQKNKEKFETDNNLGLVKQVVSSMYKCNIQRLTQTYLTLSLQDMAITVQLKSFKEAEMHVLQMIQDGEIYATINQKDGMVRFVEDPEQYKTCQLIEHIDLSIQRIMALSKKLSAMDEHMSCDALYLAKGGRERHRLDFEDFDGVPEKFNI